MQTLSFLCILSQQTWFKYHGMMAKTALQVSRCWLILAFPKTTVVTSDCFLQSKDCCLNCCHKEDKLKSLHCGNCISLSFAWLHFLSGVKRYIPFFTVLVSWLSVIRSGLQSTGHTSESLFLSHKLGCFIYVKLGYITETGDTSNLMCQ